MAKVKQLALQYFRISLDNTNQGEFWANIMFNPELSLLITEAINALESIIKELDR